MSRMTFVAGAVLTASQVNTYLMKQAVDVCTSSTRPSSPTEGQVIYETDTDRLMVYSTATTTWQPPWNLPWGKVASASAGGVDQGSVTTATDATGVTVTFTAVANRNYVVRCPATFFIAGSTGVFTLSVTDSGNAVKGNGSMDFLLSTAGTQSSGEVVTDPFTLAAGSQTLKLRVAASAGTGTVYNSKRPASIVVEDKGPSAAPA